MKKDLVKSMITIGGLGTLYLLTIVGFGALIWQDKLTENLFMIVLTLFTNVVSSIITYYFTRKVLEKKEGE